MQIETLWRDLELDSALLADGDLEVRTPINGELIGSVAQDNLQTVQQKITLAHQAFMQWRSVPAPRRGELIRLFGMELRHHKEALGALVTLESGKILQEGLGEVQEMIDICDFAVGLSRQLYGLTMPSERPGHRMSEYWHPIGVVGVISAFNFPVAVWAWNATLAIVCGDAVLWKPSEKTPLTAIACKQLFARAAAQFGNVPNGLVETLIGGPELSAAMVEDSRLPVISATGSSRMGRAVAPKVAQRFGRCILELGGNNAMIVTPSADLELAIPAILFSAVGTAGQRCTTLRRLIAHQDIHDDLLARVKTAFAQIRIGDPFAKGTLVGPLIDGNAYNAMQETLQRMRDAGCVVTGGERVDLNNGGSGGNYVKPAIVEVNEMHPQVAQETFAPILYVMRYRHFDDAITLHNDVPQGLSSCVFTQDLIEAELFLSARGSDCGIANVNIGPSGAEIGGAFGGEKETGGGRESGSDAWKAYMRRCTATVNYSNELPLAQGIDFGQHA